MKKYITLLLISISINSYCQDFEAKDWRVNSALGFSIGYLREDTRSSNIHGFLGVLFKDKIELRGDGYYFLGNTGFRPRFSKNHQIMAGAFYHFLDKKFQPYMGFQPGIAISQSSEFGTLNSSTGDIEYQTTINPIFSMAGGFTLYAQKWFLMFVEVRQIYGKHKSNTYPVYLDEFRFSFGFGFTF
jgi:hypothetical protein